MAEWSHYDDYEPTARQLFPDDPDSTRFAAWQARRKGYADQDPSAAASGSQMPVAPAPKQDKPKAVKEKELLQFRREASRHRENVYCGRGRSFLSWPHWTRRTQSMECRLPLQGEADGAERSQK